MSPWLFCLFALAQASCYDYEYYDEVTKKTIPGNACAQQAAAKASGGQPQAFGIAQPTTAFGVAQPVSSTAPFSTTAFPPAFPPAFPNTGSTPIAYSSAPVAPAPYVVSTPYVSAPISNVPVYSSVSFPTASYGGPVATRLPVAQTVAVSPVAVSSQVRSTASTPGVSAELQYYKDLGERQARQHKRNTRIVRDASQDLSKTSLVNRLVAGSGNAAPWYPALRLSDQKKAAEAYKSEKRIANKNAEDAYQRFQTNPTQLNLLVSKYQDLNADLRGAAYQYNVVNSGTFGQRISSGSIFGGLSGGLLGGVTQIITQKKQSEDLQDIQRKMKRVARQIQAAAQSSAQQKSAGQDSVQQRMMAMSVYGPARSG